MSRSFHVWFYLTRVKHTDLSLLLSLLFQTVPSKMPPLNQSYPPSSTFYFSIESDNHSGGVGVGVREKGEAAAAAGGALGEGFPDFPPGGSMSKDHSWMYPLLEQMRDERTFDPTTEALLILAFALFISVGVLGNGMVCFVVARNPHMRTPRNIFIINLAISDLTLCVFTQPLNLYLLICTQWELGSFMCKLVTMFQGTNLFVSTISITAIALDRFQVKPVLIARCVHFVAYACSTARLLTAPSLEAFVLSVILDFNTF